MKGVLGERELGFKRFFLFFEGMKKVSMTLGRDPGGFSGDRREVQEECRRGSKRQKEGKRLPMGGQREKKVSVFR